MSAIFLPLFQQPEVSLRSLVAGVNHDQPIHFLVCQRVSLGSDEDVPVVEVIVG